MTGRRLVQGCYLACFTTGSGVGTRHYDGTLRVHINDGEVLVSGDLYERTANGDKPDPENGIPILRLDTYRFYLKSKETQPAMIEAGLNLKLFFCEFKRTSPNPRDFEWTETGPHTVNLKLTHPPEGEAFPDADNEPLYLRGPVTDTQGREIGSFSLGWVDPYLRRARLKIARVVFGENGSQQKSEVPWDNGVTEELVTWQSVLGEVGWKLELPAPGEVVEIGEEGISEEWDAGELHKQMLELRNLNTTNTDWCYHLLCVPKIVESYGLMFDDADTDFHSNELPREGFAISSHIEYPDEARWGIARAKRCGQALIPYFRTAVHEIAHAMGLQHDHQPNGRHIMTETAVLHGASTAENGKTVPERILFSFTEAGAKRLRHMPDIWVRPGGIPFDESTIDYSYAPISTGDRLVETEDVRLEVFPLLKEVPYGAPVRINYRLTNVCGRKVAIPPDLSLKSGCVKGTVIDAAGTERRFSSILQFDHRSDPARATRNIGPGKSVLESMTLVQGRGGALFPKPGEHQIGIEVFWRDAQGRRIGRAGQTRVWIVPACDAGTTQCGKTVSENPRTLIALAIRGDHCKESIEPALANPELRRHYAVAEAKRLGHRFFSRPAELEQAAELLLEDPVMSSGEIDWIVKAILRADQKIRESSTVVKLCGLLRNKVKTMGSSIDERVRESVQTLPG
ncbi:MAG TPA: matrixin family metalloprotease [Verrucomicrobiae bacterium]|nr:matrixin family metalloprotease [Verrucomicrobiae bacterium]